MSLNFTHTDTREEETEFSLPANPIDLTLGKKMSACQEIPSAQQLTHKRALIFAALFFGSDTHGLTWPRQCLETKSLENKGETSSAALA
jgi:hypothetical protein